MTNQDRLNNVAEADQVADLMEHVGWTMAVKPALLKHRTALTSTLVGAVLGQALPNGLTKEQIAGRIEGIDEIIRVFEKILKQGEKSLRELEGQGFTLTATTL